MAVLDCVVGKGSYCILALGLIVFAVDCMAVKAKTMKGRKQGGISIGADSRASRVNVLGLLVRVSALGKLQHGGWNVNVEVAEAADSNSSAVCGNSVDVDRSEGGRR